MADELAARIRAQEGGGGSGGAPDNAQYILGAPSGGLSNAIVIPSLRINPDRVTTGGTINEHFDDGTEGGFTWLTVPAAHDSNTTRESHWAVRTVGVTGGVGERPFSPTGDFEFSYKLGISHNAGDAANPSMYVGIFDATTQNGGVVFWQRSGVNYQVRPVRVVSGSDVFGSLVSVQSNVVYIKISRTGTTWRYFFSLDGIDYLLLLTATHSFTVSKLRFAGGGAHASADVTWFMDWLRVS